MCGSYLLDTSALYSLSGQRLRILSEMTTRFLGSPYSFWEIIAHLDAPGQFAHYKAQLMKFRYVQVLDDPRAEIESTLLPKNRDLQKQVPDYDLIYATLAALRASSSLDDFYSKCIKDSNGEFRQVRDMAARVRKLLETEEKRHICFLNEIIGVFCAGQPKLDRDRERHEAILALLDGWGADLKQRGASKVGLRKQLIIETYIYYSYIFHRAAEYFKNKKTNLDGNDYEDGLICLHLRLDTPFCVVTADKGMRKALGQTIALLDRLKEPQVGTTLQVIDVNRLK